MWPHWEEYKKKVALRKTWDVKFFYELGLSVIRVVEEAGMEDVVDGRIAQLIGEAVVFWDTEVEDWLADHNGVAHGVFVMYWGS